MIKLVTFDVTGTLLGFRKPVFEQYSNIAQLYGLTVNADVIKYNFKAYWPLLNSEHPNFGQSSGIGWYEWWTRLVKNSFPNQCDQQKLKLITEHLIEHFKTDKAWCLLPHAKSVLNSLAQRNDFELGIISNFDPRLHILLHNMAISNYFSFVLTSYEVKCMKPNSIIYNKALELAKLKSGKEALHVGNDKQLDFVGAKIAGWHALILDPTENHPNTISSLLEVPTAVNQIIAARQTTPEN